MATRKIQTVKIKESNRRWLSVLLMVFFVAFLLQIEFIQEVLKTIFPNVDWPEVGRYASVVGWTALGVSLIAAGSATMAIPFVGVGFAVVGGLILLTQALKVWNEKLSSGKIEGLGTFDTPK